MSSTWKDKEREVCRDHDAMRTGPRGFHLPDCTPETYPVSIEVKYRERIANWLQDMVDQSEDEAYDDYLPIVVLCEKGRRMGDNLVIIPYWAWRRLYDEYIVRGP
jgi:hypothetical protein